MGLLIVVFFLLTPVIILYTAGYRYDWQQHQILQTGVISVDVLPDDARVFLQGTEFTNIPLNFSSDAPATYHFKNLAPGTYQLSLQKPGYKTWERDITVHSKRTTYIQGIHLIKESLPIPIDIDIPVSSQPPPASSARGSFLLIISEVEPVYDVSVFDTRTQQTYPLLRTQASTTPRASWSPTRSMVAIYVTQASTASIYLVSAENPQLISQYTVSTTQAATSFQWGPDGASLIIQDGHQLTRLYVDQTKIMASHVSSSIWHVAADDTVWSFATTTDTLIQYANDDQKLHTQPLNESIETIVNIQPTYTLARQRNQFVIIQPTNQNRQYIPTQYIRRDLLTKNQDWVSWSASEIWSIDSQGNGALLHRTSDHIINVWPLNQYGLLLIATKSGIHTLSPIYYLTHELFRAENLTVIGVNDKIRKIYFLGTVGQTTDFFELSY